MNLKLAPSDYEVYIPLAEWIEGNIKDVHRLLILWSRADILYDSENSSNPYHLAEMALPSDLVESFITRTRASWTRNLAREIVKLQYPTSDVSNPYLISGEGGLRDLYKDITLRHATTAFDILKPTEIQEILQDLSKDKVRDERE